MAIRLIDRYPNRADPATTNYPHGQGRNKSDPTADDGTPYEADWFNDAQALMQGMLEAAGITPSGNVDTVPQSDYLDALVQVANGVTEIDMAGDTDVTLDVHQSRVAALRLTGSLTADVDLVVPDTARYYLVIDATTGEFEVTLRTQNGTGVALRQGSSQIVYSDGVDAKFAVLPHVDEDSMSSDSDAAVPTQGSVRAFVGAPGAEAPSFFRTTPDRGPSSFPEKTWLPDYTTLMGPHGSAFHIDAYSERITPRQILPYAGGYMCLYLGGDVGNSAITTGLAFSPDGYSWFDSPENPILDQLDQDWQGTRSMGNAIAWDDANGEWVLFAGGNDASSTTPGARAVGIFTSPDLVTWTADADNPTLTINDADILTWAPGEDGGTADADRVYITGIAQINGKWHALVEAGYGSQNTGGMSRAVGVLTADDPRGPWSGGSHNPVITSSDWGDRLPSVRSATYYDGYWYTVVTEPGTWLNLGAARSSDFLNWTVLNGGSPLITTGGNEVDAAIVMPFSDHWAILGSQRTGTRNMIMWTSRQDARIVHVSKRAKARLRSLKSSDSGRTSVVVGDRVTVAAGAYHTVLDISGATAEVLSGEIWGVNVGCRITVDGDVVIDDTATAIGHDNGGNNYGSFPIPPIQGTDITVELYNAHNASVDHGWRIIHR